jgi:hypothetical protein
MKGRTLPEWAAPLVGPVIGAILAWRACDHVTGEFKLTWVVTGAIFGFVGGGILWLWGRPRKE